jgi:CDP-diacylglycerol--glycerol-3-phosphate 3-phosphatidyltransferase
MKDMMKKNHLLNVPNILTYLRIILIPLIIAMFYIGTPVSLAFSLIIFVIACITDSLDGFIARKYNLITPLGTFFDPIADKMLILSMFFIFSEKNLIPLWMPLLFLFREFVVSGIRQVGSLKGKMIGANWMGKTKATLQMVLIIFSLIYLIIESSGRYLPYGKEIIFYGTLCLVIISFIFTFEFIRWNKRFLVD